MKHFINLTLLILMLATAGSPALGKAVVGDTAGSASAWNALGYAGSLRPVQGMAPSTQGGEAETRDQEQPLEDSDLARASKGKSTIGDAQTGLPASAIKLKWPKGAMAAMARNMANTDGRLPTNSEMQLYLANFAATLAAGTNAPDKQMHAAKANLDAQGTEVANSMADLEKQQAASAIDFCSSFLTNFTTEGGNKWNALRDNIFLPMAVLLLLPGAILTQVKSIIAAGTPVLGEVNPFEGLQRSLIAIFLIPGTYLVLNYSIDLNNSITYSIAEEYTRLFGSNMYRDAISFHIRAFPSRQPGENRNALDQQTARMTPLLGGRTAFARFEGKMIENKIEDPVARIYQAPPDRADEALANSAIMAKTMFNSTNATFMIAWNILCAFQMVYFYYLWFVGPITAALWAWPMRTLRNAFPSWCEGVITLGFWSLFWNTSILLMACFRGVDETGTLILTALNFLATSSVKYAFDFAGLAKAAGQEAAQMAEKAAKAGGGGGGGGGKGGGHSKGKGKHGGHHAPGHGTQPVHADSETPTGGGAGTPVEGGRRTELAGLPLNDRLVALNRENDERPIRVASGDPDAGFRELARREALKDKPPPVAGEDSSVRTLPGNSFGVEGEQGGHMFTRSMVDGKPVLTVTDLEGNKVRGMDGQELGPISLSDIPEGGSKAIQFDPDAEGKPRGSINIEQGTHGGQLYTASSHGHSELVSFAGGHLRGHQSAAVDSGMHAAMMGHRPVAEIQPGLFYGSDGNGGGALYDIDHNKIEFKDDGTYEMADGRSLYMESMPDGSQSLTINGQDMYALAAQGDNISVRHGDLAHNPYDNPTNSLYMGRDANTGASIATLYNEHGQRTESSSTLGADTSRSYYNADTQALMGSSFTHNFDNGNSITSYSRDDGSLVGTSFYQMTDTGFSETLYDASGLPVSLQQTSYDDSGYSVTSANFVDGSISNASIAQYDNSGTFVSSSPLDYHHMQALAGDVSSISQYANTTGGVVPDGGVFGAARQVEVANNYGTPFTSSRVDVVPPQMVDPKVVGEQRLDYAVPQNPSMLAKADTPGEVRSLQAMPVDIAGTQLQPNKDFSQVDGAYAANLTSQAQYAEVAYNNPVVTASVDVVPPQVLDSTPIAYQQAELAAPTRSLESQMAAHVGDLSVTGDTAFNFNSTLGPPAGTFSVARDAAPEVQQFAAASPQMNTVLPVDIAGTQITDNKPAYELAQNAQIEGAYAQPGQGIHAEVAYSNPVVTSNVDVVPPVVLDSTPISYQQAELAAPKASLESMMANQVGGLSASETAFNFTNQGPPSGSFAISREAAPEVQQFAAANPQYGVADPKFVTENGQLAAGHPQAGTGESQIVATNAQFGSVPQVNTVLPVDIAGTQISESRPAAELARNAQIEGAYAQPGQGAHAEVAYSNPVVTSNVDVVPPAVLDSTPVAYQQAELNAPKVSLETQMANQVGGLSASEVVVSQPGQGAAPPTVTYDNSYTSTGHTVNASVDNSYTATGHTASASVDSTYTATGHTASASADSNHPTAEGGLVASSQVTQGPEVYAKHSAEYEHEYGHTRTESAAQLASAAAIASNAQQHLLGDPKVEHRTNEVRNAGPDAPKRGLGSIFSDITMGKKAVKPGDNANAKVNPGNVKSELANTKLDPNANANAKGRGGAGDANQSGPGGKQEPTVLMGKMRDTAESGMTVSTNQSLEKQMLQAGSHSMPASTFGSILGKTNASAPQKPSEHLTNALVDYHTVTGLIHEGKTNEAALVAGNALANISRCNGTEPQLLPLVKAFVELFNQKRMIHQANAFAEKERALTELQSAAASTKPGSNDNIWGA